MKIEITDAKPEGAFDIQNVFYKTWIAIYPNEEHCITLENLKYRWKNMLSEESVDGIKKLIKNLDDNFKFLVAKVDDKIVGASFLETYDDHNRFQSIYILPNYQGLGVGKKIWKQAEKFFNLSNETLVDVAVYNEKAIKFYEKLGFTDTGKRFLEEKSKDPKVVQRPMLEMELKGKSKNGK